MAYSTKGDVSTIAAGEDSEASGPSTTDAAADADQASAPLPDLTQPQKWPVWRKRVYIVLVGYCECLTFLVSMMLAPSVPQVLSDFDAGDRKALGSFSVTVYILGFCVGPLLLAPLTDLYGRLLIYRGAALGFLAFTLACAVSPSIGALITFRFFAGCFGGAPMAIGGAVIADMYAPGDRDGPMAAYSVGTMMGPTIGPVLGGVITGLLGWRWVFWIAGILSVVANIGLFFILPETHLPTLEKRHVRHNVRNAAVKKPLKHQIIHLDTNVLAKTIARAVSLPSRLSLHLPVFLILLLICIFNGLINMILSSLGFVYQTRYHFLPTTSGLSYLGIGFGGITALAVTKLLKRYVSEVAGKKNLAEGPEGALIFLAMVPPVTTVGLLWYGWALQAMTHWIIPILGLFGFGFGYMCTRLSATLFLVEAVKDYTASALAAFTVASSVGGAVVPLSTFPLYDGVGYGWGNTVIAAVNLSLSFIPLAMYMASRKLGGRWEREVTLEFRDSIL